LPGQAHLLKDIVTIQPAQMRGTEIVRGAEIKRIDTRDLSQRQFAAPQEAVKVIAEELALLRDSQQVLSTTQKQNAVL
jgi:hypothetical protein